MVSAQEAEDLKLKEKRKREREVTSVSKSCSAYKSTCFVTYIMYIKLLVRFVTTQMLLDGNIYYAEKYA